jgi:transposase
VEVIQHVREKMTCRDCEKVSEPPAPFHVTPRGWAGPNLLAMLLFEKFGQHQPLNRQAQSAVGCIVYSQSSRDSSSLRVPP